MRWVLLFLVLLPSVLAVQALLTLPDDVEVDAPFTIIVDRPAAYEVRVLLDDVTNGITHTLGPEQPGGQPVQFETSWGMPTECDGLVVREEYKLTQFGGWMDGDEQTMTVVQNQDIDGTLSYNVPAGSQIGTALAFPVQGYDENRVGSILLEKLNGQPIYEKQCNRCKLGCQHTFMIAESTAGDHDYQLTITDRYGNTVTEQFIITWQGDCQEDSDCDDQDLCTTDTCDLTSQECEYTPMSEGDHCDVNSKCRFGATGDLECVLTCYGFGLTISGHNPDPIRCLNFFPTNANEHQEYYCTHPNTCYSCTNLYHWEGDGASTECVENAMVYCGFDGAPICPDGSCESGLQECIDGFCRECCADEDQRCPLSTCVGFPLDAPNYDPDCDPPDAPLSPICGDGECSPGAEDIMGADACPEDCCGDGQCTGDEDVPGSSVACPADCHVPCLIRASTGCYNNNVHYFDSCGNRGALVEECGGGTHCEEGDDSASCVLDECDEEPVYECHGRRGVSVECGVTTTHVMCNQQERCVADDDNVGCVPIDPCGSLDKCGAYCVDFDTDRRHCGVCFNPCRHDEECNQGLCEPVNDCIVECYRQLDCGEGFMCVHPGSCASHCQPRLHRNGAEDLFTQVENEVDLSFDEFEEVLAEVDEVLAMGLGSEYDGERTTMSLSLQPQANLGDVSIPLEIPKCMAEYVNEMELTGNYRVVKDDPLIVWQFDELNHETEITFNVPGDIDEECKAQLKALAFAERIQKPLNPWIALLLIPLVAVTLIFFQRFKPQPDKKMPMSKEEFLATARQQGVQESELEKHWEAYKKQV